MNKIYKIIKTALFVISGILVFIFAHDFVANEGANINLYVGIVMAFFGIECVTLMLIKKEVKEEPIKFLNGFVNILLAIIMIFLLDGNGDEVRIACTIWCVWSIMREGEEIYEKVLEGIKEHPITSIINLIESVVVIIFSIGLITIPAHELVEDALKHVYLLGVELILEVCWHYLGELEVKLYKHKK